MFQLSGIPTVLLTILIYVVGPAASTEFEVQTTIGKMRGGTGGSTSKNKNFIYIWKGVPYAEPPVGDLRFKKPVKAEKRQPRRQGEPAIFALEDKPGCPQYSERSFPWYDFRPGSKREPAQSEDCLYLKIWAPSNKQNVPRPVKIYLHGGGWFQGGSARMNYYYDGTAEARDTMNDDGSSNADGIVVVFIQYRLGPLGFLTSGTDDAPGNMGLLDIKLAMEFLLDNLRVFGGDTDKITVVGQDGGAIAAGLLLTNPDLFPKKFKVVVNGGSLLTLKALPGVDEQGDAYDNNLRLTDLLAESVGCNTTVRDDPEGTIECLRGIEFERLVKTMDSLSQKGPPNVFLPQIKGTHNLFSDNPYKALAENPDVAGQDTLGSFTSDEGSYLLTTAFPKVFGDFGENDTALSASCAKLAARSFLRKFPPSVADELLGDLDKEATIENRNKVVQAFGDAYFSCPVVFYVEQLKSKQGDSNRTFILGKQVIPPYNPWADWMGSAHFSNVPIDFLPIFDFFVTWNAQGKVQKPDYSKETLEQSKLYHDLFTKFITGQDLPIDEFTTDNPAYGVLAKDGTISSNGTTNYHGKNCDILRPFFQYKG